MKANVDLSIIIVSWNSGEDLRSCLKSIDQNEKNSNFEVFVVDNASQDGTPLMVKKEFPNVKLISNKQNQGFAKANNQAIRYASGRFLLLLNPDTKVEGGTLVKALNYMDQNKKVGVLGCKTVNPDGSLQKSVRRFPDLFSQIIILTKLHHFFPNLDSLKRYFANDFDYQKIQNADQVMGAFFMIRKECLDDIGLLDEDFWIWFEEVDFCRRAHKKNWQVVYNPNFTIMHKQGQSFYKLKATKEQYIFNRSLFHYFWKHRPKWEYVILAVFYPISLALAFLVELLESIKSTEKIKCLN